jgi:hypothetical protein
MGPMDEPEKSGYWRFFANRLGSPGKPGRLGVTPMGQRFHAETRGYCRFCFGVSGLYGHMDGWCHDAIVAR